MSEPNQSGLSDNAAGALAYVTIIPAIIFLIVEPLTRTPTCAFTPGSPSFLVLPSLRQYCAQRHPGYRMDNHAVYRPGFSCDLGVCAAQGLERPALQAAAYWRSAEKQANA